MAQSTRDTFQITGAVLNSQTGAPVKGALVMVNALPVLRGDVVTAPQTEGLLIQPIPVLTDVTGSYQFPALPAGRYQVSAEKPGFTADRPQGPDLIELGPSREGFTLRLSPLAKIRGKVTSRDGNPVPGVAIRALRAEIRDGRRTAVAVRSVNSDDLGRYRLWNLAPGSYYVVAAGRGGGTQLFVGHANCRGELA